MVNLQRFRELNRIEKLEDIFELDEKPLGKGSFGTVYKGRYKGGQNKSNDVAIK